MIHSVIQHSKVVRVLHLDDEELTHRYTSLIFHDANFHFTLEYTPVLGGVRELSDFMSGQPTDYKPDLAIVDMRMPNGGDEMFGGTREGRRAVESLRNYYGANRVMKVVFLTGLRAYSNDVYAVSQQGYEVLFKENFDEVSSRLTEIVTRIAACD